MEIHPSITHQVEMQSQRDINTHKILDIMTKLELASTL